MDIPFVSTTTSHMAEDAINIYCQVSDRVEFFPPFQRRSSQPISWLSTEKLNLTQQKQTCIHNNTNTQKLKPALVVSYDLQPGNGTGLFLKRQRSKKVRKLSKQ